jgi:poly-gamma-glutamate capsule biosynthesis protein CapA/YwtB (metallophosphatase superfamily)
MIHQLSPEKQLHDSVTIVCTGDIVLDEPDADYWLDGIVPAFAEADIVIGHLEVPHTRRRVEHGHDVPAPGADPDNLDALGNAGFDVMTLAGNHISDCGPGGIQDTVEALTSLGISHCGAGRNLMQARRPAVIRVGPRRIAVLSYNCVGPASGWAGEDLAGCAYLPVATASGETVAPAATLTHPLPAAYTILHDDISGAREQADLVIVALHKGTVHTPVRIEAYERELAHAAVDAGADVVLSHHAHIIRGVEFYRDKPVFHGLGNGCVVTRALSPDQDHAGRAAWAEKRKQLFGFEPDPAYFLAPFHPEAVHAFLARLNWLADGTLEAGIIPVRVDPPGKPRLAKGDEMKTIGAYLEAITEQAGLDRLQLEYGSDMVRMA